MDGMVGYEQVDPLTLVWSIRPGMQFHNGDPVDSEAVAFSFGRLTKLYDHAWWHPSVARRVRVRRQLRGHGRAHDDGALEPG